MLNILCTCTPVMKNSTYQFNHRIIIRQSKTLKLIFKVINIIKGMMINIIQQHMHTLHKAKPKSERHFY